MTVRWYVASPFTDPDAAVRLGRYRMAIAFLSWAASQRLRVYSPIVHWYEAARDGLMPTDAGFWRWINNADLADCGGVIVLMLKGWEASAGVDEEIAEARRLKKPVRYYRPHDERGWRWELLPDAQGDAGKPANSGLPLLGQEENPMPAGERRRTPVIGQPLEA